MFGVLKDPPIKTFISITDVLRVCLGIYDFCRPSVKYGDPIRSWLLSSIPSSPSALSLSLHLLPLPHTTSPPPSLSPHHCLQPITTTTAQCLDPPPATTTAAMVKMMAATGCDDDNDGAWTIAMGFTSFWPRVHGSAVGHPRERRSAVGCPRALGYAGGRSEWWRL